MKLDNEEVWALESDGLYKFSQGPSWWRECLCGLEEGALRGPRGSGIALEGAFQKLQANCVSPNHSCTVFHLFTFRSIIILCFFIRFGRLLLTETDNGKTQKMLLYVGRWLL